MGTLTVKQTVVPLTLVIARYGSAAPADGTEFSIAGVEIGTQSAAIQTVQDYFAPGQFLNLSDADKLSQPSFELYDAGVTIGSTAVAAGQGCARTVSYDELYIDDPANLSRFSRIYQMPAAIHLALVAQGAGFASAAKNTGLNKYSAGAAAPPITVETARYLVASVDDLSVRSDIAAATGSAFYQAQAALTAYLATHPAESAGLQILPLHEVAA